MPDLNPKGNLHCELIFEGAWPTSVAFLGSGRRLAAGNRDGTLLVWDLPEQPTKDSVPPVRKLEGHNNTINRLVATDDGKLLVSASHDRSVRFWDPTVEPTSSAEVVVDAEQRAREAKRNPKNAAAKPGIKVAVQQAQHVLTNHRGWVRGLGMSRDQKRIISGDDTGLVYVWDLASRKEVAKWTGHPGNWVTAACLSADGQTAFVGEFSHAHGSFDRPPAQARLFEAAAGKEKLDFLKVLFPNVKQRDNSYGYAQTWGKFMGMGAVGADFSPDGKLLAFGQGGERGGMCKVHLMDTATGKLLRSVSGHQDGVCDVLFSADGKFVLSTGRDTVVRICQVSDGKEVGQLGKPRGGQSKDWMHAVALSPDQQWAAGADIAGRVSVWKMG